MKYYIVMELCKFCLKIRVILVIVVFGIRLDVLSIFCVIYCRLLIILENCLLEFGRVGRNG